MTGEFIKPNNITPAVLGQIANPDDYNQNIAGQSKDAIVGIDADGSFADVDLGDETLITNGALIKNIKLREGYFLKYYNASGVFQRNVNLGQATTSLLGQTYLNKVITIANSLGTPNTIINFGAGVAQADDGSLVFTVSATSKILQNSGSWAAGNNQNGLDTGARANSTYYYCFAIYNPTTLASDFLFSASKASPTLPSGYTKKCYLGALVTDGSGNIRNGTYRFIANGIYEFYLNVEITERSVTTTTNSVTVTSPSGTFARCRVSCVLSSGGSNNNSEGWASDIFSNFAGAGQVANIGTTRGSSTYLYNNGSIAIGVGGQTGCTVNLYSNGWKETAN